MKAKKEKHPVYWAVMACLILILALGIALLAMGLAEGRNTVLLPPGVRQ